jgi:hypothetical protein
MLGGDPKECRLRARQCLLIANRAASPQEQRTFERIHRSWNRLAVEIESAQAFLATSRATELAECLAPVTPIVSRQRAPARAEGVAEG